MTDDDQDTLTAELREKDGQLQIVEMSPYDNGDGDGHHEQILPDVGQTSSEHDDGDMKYVQVVDPSGKGLMHLDLLNFTLVRCENGDESEYRLVANSDVGDCDDGEGDDSTVTCVLRSSEGDDNEESYMMVEGEQGSLVFLEAAEATPTEVPKPTLSPTELIERAKAIQKAKALLNPTTTRRKRKGDLPPPHELLSSPKFKLYLYSCKQCSFKCNAIKELTAHRMVKHAGNANRWRGGGGSSHMLQCARCPYKASSQPQLMRHARERHLVEVASKGSEKSTEGAAAAAAVATTAAADAGKWPVSGAGRGDEPNVFVCGACGFESVSDTVFNRHIERAHGNQGA